MIPHPILMDVLHDQRNREVEAELARRQRVDQGNVTDAPDLASTIDATRHLRDWRRGSQYDHENRLTRRTYALLAAFVLLALLSAVLNSWPLAAAQEATPMGTVAMATHPIVGTWRLMKDFGEGPTISYAIFHADGTYLQEAFVEGPIEFGAWEPTGERTADLRIRHLYLWDDRVVEAEARAALTVAKTDARLDGDEAYVSRYVDDGTIEYTFETPITATRVTAARMVSLETLIAETEG